MIMIEIGPRGAGVPDVCFDSATVITFEKMYEKSMDITVHKPHLLSNRKQIFIGLGSPVQLPEFGELAMKIYIRGHRSMLAKYTILHLLHPNSTKE